MIETGDHIISTEEGGAPILEVLLAEEGWLWVQYLEVDLRVNTWCVPPARAKNFQIVHRPRVIPPRRRNLAL